VTAGRESDLSIRAPRGPVRLKSALGWSAFLLTVVLVTVALAFDVLTMGPESWSRRVGHYAYLTLALPLSLAGALITAQRPGNRIGILLLVEGVTIAGDESTRNYLLYCRAHHLSGLWPIGWLSNWLWLVPPAVLLLGLLVYPDGRLPGRRWWVLAWVVWAWAAVTAVLAMLGAGNYSGPASYRDAILPGHAGRLIETALPYVFLVFPFLLVGAAASTVVRFRRARGVERSQLKWLAYAGSVLAVLWLFPPVHELGTPARAVANVALWLLPTAIAIGVLRYRLYEIDRIINRTLVYGLLTLCLAGTYVLVIASLDALFRQRSGLVISMVASVSVALILAPLRARLQRAVDRMLYGQRAEPFTVVSRLGQQLESALPPDQVLPTIVDTLATALKVPYVAIELYRDGALEPACVRGVMAGDPAAFGLTYRGEPLGQLMLGPRAPGEAFSQADRELMRNLARHAGVAVHAVRLTDDLQRSRERLVTAREEERRRLRRDLHDGLGPTLAGIGFQLDAMASVLPAQPVKAAEALTKVKSDVRQTVAEVRRLVEGLRPPALDQLGLVPAIRQHGALLGDAGGQTGKSLAVEVHAPASIPVLPAAVEVAAYRIATEAITNVFRHADAQHCTVQVRLSDGLELEVTDDGRGPTEPQQSGFGLRSMRERTAELGGTCVIESSPGTGTRVLVRLPIHPGDRS
jgi:two-component system NarL family sensor kinase